MLFKLYRYLRILSLDVALGSCISALFVANYLQVAISYSALFTLGLCVWLIYTADHLMDAYHIKHKAHSRRHLYHQKYFKRLVYLFIVVASLGFVSLIFLPTRTIYWGLALLAFVFLHFIILKLIGIRPSAYKEFIVAFLYAAGIFLVSLSVYNGPFNKEILVLFVQFFLTALINLLLFGMIEEEIDKKDGQVSFVQWAGKKRTLTFTWILLSISFCYPIYTFITTTNNSLIINQMIILAMNLTLGIIMFDKNYFKKKERYRAYGDAIFLYPIIVL
ncbi:hypothetical protein QQ008_21840 [Fulvivirgaceae bacterium BMA10]|uniref:Prenyltransferase n=1 Tax=Splendidivirga corallicola TaxID=3051826 RepID=A0ABT8KTG3_9BACT|nr:hypothetical protein [Fulvivirgaceae bacterium BMA10]